MKTRRILAMMICALLSVAVLNGCSQKEPAATSEGSETAAATTAALSTSEAGGEQSSAVAGETVAGGAYTLPLSTTSEVLRIAGPENSGDRTYESGLPVFQEMEEKTGVKIVFEAVISSEYDTTIRTRMAAGTDLPDIMAIPGSDNIPKYGKDGVILDISQLIRDFAPNIAEWFEKEPVARRFMTTPEGMIYTLPNELVEDNGAANDSLMPPAHVIRGDWLENLNLEMPTTIDELEQVLTAFRDQDPNGNGQKDEIPYSFPGGRSIIRFLGWSYGLHLGFNDGWYPDADGKVQYELITPAYKDLLTLASRWYKEGLLDNGFTPENWEKWNSQIISGLVGCVPMSTIYPDAVWNATIRENENNPEAGFVPMYPVAGPDGIVSSEASFASCNSARFAISGTCQNPELAIKFLDYTCYSPQGLLWNEFGVEGDTYTMVNGEPVFTEETAQSTDGLTNEMWRRGGYHYILPQVLSARGRKAAFLQYESVFDISAKIYSEVTVNTPLFVTGMATVEEAEQLASLSADMNTYIGEMTDKFILGDIPISDFESVFVETLKSMGLEEQTAIKQAQYERFNAN